MGRKLLCMLLAVAGMVLSAWLRPNQGEESTAGFCPPITAPQGMIQELNKPQEVAFPCVLEDSGLVAEYMRGYDGPYLEDGSNDPVKGVAALMVYNAGSRDISSAMVTVERKGERLHFFLTWLPAGCRVLVLESGRAAFESSEVTGCSVTGVRWETFCADGVTVEMEENGRLLVTNRGGRALRNVRLRYKLFSHKGDFYVGGITYCICVGNLGSGESRDIAAGGDGLGFGRVVAVLTD